MEGQTELSKEEISSIIPSSSPIKESKKPKQLPDEQREFNRNLKNRLGIGKRNNQQTITLIDENGKSLGEKEIKDLTIEDLPYLKSALDAYDQYADKIGFDKYHAGTMDLNRLFNKLKLLRDPEQLEKIRVIDEEKRVLINKLLDKDNDPNSIEEIVNKIKELPTTNTSPIADAEKQIIGHVLGKEIKILDDEGSEILIPKKGPNSKLKEKIKNATFEIDGKSYTISNLTKSDYENNKNLFDLLEYIVANSGTKKAIDRKTIGEIVGRILADKIKEIKDLDKEDQIARNIGNHVTGKIYLGGNVYNISDINDETIASNIKGLINILSSEKRRYHNALAQKQRRGLGDSKYIDIYEELDDKVKKYLDENNISLELKDLYEAIEGLRDTGAVVDENDNVLKDLNIRAREGGSAEFIKLDRNNIQKFLQSYFGNKLKVEKIISNLYNGDTKDAEIASLAEKIIKDNKSVIFPRDESYGFADYFIYDLDDKGNPNLESKQAISIKKGEVGGGLVTLNGFKSTFGHEYDISKPLESIENSSGQIDLEEKARSIARSYLRSFNDNSRNEKRIKILDSLVSTAIERGIYGDLNEEKVRNIIRHKMKKEIIQASRVLILLKSGAFKDKFKEIRIIDGKESDIPLDIKNLGIDWDITKSGKPIIKFKFYSINEVKKIRKKEKQSTGRGVLRQRDEKEKYRLRNFSSSIQKAVSMLKSSDFSEAKFNKFMRENSWQVI